MFECNYALKKLFFFIQLTEKFFIFSRAKTKTHISLNAQTDLLLNALNDKIIHRIRQLFAIIVIVIDFSPVVAFQRKA